VKPLLLIALVWTLGACAPRLPTHELLSPADTWLALRAQAPETVSAVGEVTLWTGAGRATLQCALASDSAGRFRLRAWKLDQAALDITLTPDGLWIYTAQADADVHRLRAADLARAWSLLSGRAFHQPPPEATLQGARFAYAAEDGVRITVHRPTRTARAFAA
jgi:hypothetical protein